MMGYTLHKNQTEEELHKAIQLNTEQIKNIAVAASTQSNNSEIIIQILNLIQDKPAKEVSAYPLPVKFLNEIDNSEVELSFKQLTADQYEVMFGIGALNGGSLFQGEALYNILNKLKEKNKTNEFSQAN
jgi:ATP-dependent protease ClpP protease subunit